MKSFRVIAPILAWLIAASPAPADAGTGKRELIVRLVEVTGASDRVAQVLQAVVGQLAPVFPDVPSEFWQELTASIDVDELIDRVVPIYEKHFTMEELSALVEFYESPVGRSYTSKLPLVLQDSMTANEQWGMEKAEEIVGRLLSEGYEPAEI